MMSDNWVVHGDHTETGMPLFASDPHLDCSIPSAWLLYSLEWPDGKVLSGAQIPGYPMIAIGRNNDVTWGFTTSRVDTSDLWQEKLNEEETEYLLDGQWRKLETLTENIKIKGQPDKILQVKSTHRGPIISFEHLKLNSALLFGGQATSMANPGVYSFAWQGQVPKDDATKLFFTIFEAKDLPSLFEALDGD